MYKTTVVVDGMHCSMCESQVKSLVMKILPDAKLSASHRKGTLTIEGAGACDSAGTSYPRRRMERSRWYDARDIQQLREYLRCDPGVTYRVLNRRTYKGILRMLYIYIILGN